MKAILKDNKGATSVLVIFMMVVLVVFATLAFTIAYANYRLSQKTAATTANNYALDDLAAHMLLQVDTCLADAELFAQQTLQNPSGAGGEYAALVRSASDSEALQRLFLAEAARQLELLTGQTDGVYLQHNAPYEDGNFLDTTRVLPDEKSLRVTIALTTGDEPGDKQLDVVLDILPLRYEVSQSGGDVRAADYTARYSVTQWKQWQIPFTYDDSLQFGEGKLILD